MPYMGKEVEQKEIPVYEVPTAEEEFDKQMSDILSANDPTNIGTPSVAEDSVVQGFAKKKALMEKLLFFKEEHTKEVEIGGVRVKMKLLNSNDHSFVTNLIKEYNINEVYKRSLLLTAASIVSVDGEKLEDYYTGPEEIENPVVKRYYELCNWHMPLTTALIDVYGNFVADTEEQFTTDFLGKSQKSDTTE